MLCDICLHKIQGALSKINEQRYGLFWVCYVKAASLGKHAGYKEVM